MHEQELTEDDWAALDALATSTLRDQGRVRGLVARGPDAHGAYMVELPRFDTSDSERLSLDIDESRKPSLLYCEIRVKSEQLGDRRVFERLVREAARRVGRAEDTILTKGKDAKKLGDGVVFVGEDAEGLATGAERIPTGSQGPTELVPLFSLAIAKLEASGWPPPYAAVLGPGLWEQAASSVLGGKRSSGLDVLRAVLGDQSVLLSIPEEPVDVRGKQAAVVFSRASGGFDVVEVAPATIADVDMRGGDRILRVEQRFVLRAIDPSAAVSIVTPAPKKK